jgi:hypothetical protein
MTLIGAFSEDREAHRMSQAEINELVATLEELIDLFESVGDAAWTARLREFLSHDDIDLRRLLSWFVVREGLNDRRIMKSNGDKVEEADEDKMNARLDSLNSRVYSLANELDREEQRRPRYRKESP